MIVKTHDETGVEFGGKLLAASCYLLTSTHIPGTLMLVLLCFISFYIKQLYAMFLY